MELNNKEFKCLLTIVHKGLKVIKEEGIEGNKQEKLKWLNSVNLKLEILGYYIDTNAKDVTILDISEYLDSVISDLEKNKFNDYIYMIHYLMI